MLTSKSVSANITPGICKLLERYLLVYSMNSLLKGASILTAPQAVGAAAKAMMNVKEDELMEMPAPNTKKQFQSPGNGPMPALPVQVMNTKDFNKDNDAKKVNIEMPKDNWSAVSIEPTWFTIKSGLFGSEQMLGVKVVPFPISSVTNVIDSIAKDRASNSFEYISRKYGRLVGRFLFMFLRRLKTPGISSGLSGDPTKDILFGKTGYGNNIFLCLNKLDFNESSLVDNPRGVKKLMSMGWSSIVVADDVNKEATFCMEEFGGLCSTTPYGFIYSTLGRDHSKVFSDISDVKKSAAPFFNKSTRLSSVISEAVASRKMSDMLIKRRKREVIVEDVDSFVNTHKSNILHKIKEIKSGIDKGDLNAVRLASVDIPKAPIENMVREKEVHDNYNFAKRVLKNSLDLGDSAVHHMAALISIGAVATENPMDTTKRALKDYVNKLSGKTGLAFIKAFLAASWVYVIGVIGKRGFDIVKKAAPDYNSIKSLLTGASLVPSIQKAWKFGRDNWYLFLILIIIYVIADFVKHEGELQDEQR